MKKYVSNIGIQKNAEIPKIHKIEMPIVDTVYDVIYNKLDPKEAVDRLMTREKKTEY